jgi:hypothetical protein
MSARLQAGEEQFDISGGLFLKVIALTKFARSG